MCVIVPTRSVYLFGIYLALEWVIKKDVQSARLDGSTLWAQCQNLYSVIICLAQAPHIPKTIIPECLLKHSRIEMKLFHF